MSAGREAPAGYQAAVRSWAEHLRRGGTSTWVAWAASPPADHASGRAEEGHALPGAAQLELVRRLATRAASPGPGFAALADRALGRSGPGRGLGQQPLVWDGPVRPFGPPPVDPAQVPVAELVRVGVGVLAELLLAAGPVAERTPPSRRPWTRSPAFVLDGAPVTTDAVRRALAASGHLEGGRSPRVVLLAEPLDVALTQVWSARVQAGAPVRWRGFVERCARGDRLPEAVDVAVVARQWADRVGAASVDVVVAPGAEAAAEAAADVLGLRLGAGLRGRRGTTTPRWADLGPEAVDAVRRVNAVLGVRVGEDRSGPARRRLLAALAAGPAGSAGTRRDAAGVTLAVPRRYRGWAGRRAVALVEQLTAGDYAVHGSPRTLVPRPGSRPAHPDVQGVLEVVLDACLHQAGLGGAGTARAGADAREGAQGP